MQNATSIPWLLCLQGNKCCPPHWPSAAKVEEKDENLVSVPTVVPGVPELVLLVVLGQTHLQRVGQGLSDLLSSQTGGNGIWVSLKAGDC